MTVPNMLTLARETLRDVTGGSDTDEVSAQAQFASAAALIAIAERMRPQFVQVGPVVFSPGDISTITDIDGELAVWFKARHTRFFKGKERAAFLKWWNEYADVVRLSQALDPTAATAYNDALSGQHF